MKTKKSFKKINLRSLRNYKKYLFKKKIDLKIIVYIFDIKNKQKQQQQLKS